MYQIRFRSGLRLWPVTTLGEFSLQRYPDSLAGFKGRGGQGRKEEVRGIEEGREGCGRARGTKGRRPPLSNTFRGHCPVRRQTPNGCSFSEKLNGWTRLRRCHRTTDRIAYFDDCMSIHLRNVGFRQGHNRLHQRTHDLFAIAGILVNLSFYSQHNMYNSLTTTIKDRRSTAATSCKLTNIH